MPEKTEIDIKKDSLVVITGEEPHFISETISKLKKDVFESGGDYDLEEYDADETHYAVVIDSAMTSPFLSEKRTVIVRNTEKYDEDDIKEIVERVQKLPQYSLLLFVFSALTDSKGSNKHKDLIDYAKKFGKYIHFKKPDAKTFQKQISEMAIKEGFSFAKNALEQFSEMTAGDLSYAVGELEKLYAFCAKKKTITVNDVSAVCVPSREWRVFVLLDAVCEGNLTEGYEQLERLLAQAKKPEDAAIVNLFPMVWRQLRLLYQARAMMDERVQPESDDSDMFCPKTYNFREASAKSDFVRNKTFGLAKRLTLEQISQMLRVLAECDMRLKGVLPSIHPRETLERLLAEITAISKPIKAVTL